MTKKLTYFSIITLILSMSITLFSAEELSNKKITDKSESNNKPTQKEEEKLSDEADFETSNNEEPMTQPENPQPNPTLFIYQLNKKKFVTKSDGIILMGRLLNKENQSVDIKTHSNFLLSKKIVKKDDLTHLNKKMAKGFLAKMILKALNKGGGIGYSITGLERYAYRECRFKGIFQEKRGNARQYMTGSHLLAVIKRVHTILYQKNNLSCSVNFCV